MEQLTKEELTMLANLLASANVAVKDSQLAYQLLEKMQRMIAAPDTTE